MRRILQNGFRTFEVLKCNESRSEETYKDFSDVSSALAFLRTFLHDLLSMMNLRSIQLGVSPGASAYQLSDQQLLERIAWELAAGRLKILELRKDMPAWGQGEPAGADEEEEEAPAVAPVSQKDHWIKVMIVDADTGDPVKGASLKIKLPTGKVQDFRSDKNGEIEVKGLPENVWDIEEMKDSDSLEVVEIT